MANKDLKFDAYAEDTNYDESKIPPYTLPEALKCFDGSRVASAFDWVNRRRPELIREFKQVMYGEEPPRPDAVSFKVIKERDNALDGLAIRREIRLTFAMNNGLRRSVDVLLYLPKQSKPAPLFIGLNFAGNHVTTTEADVVPTGLAGHWDPKVMVTGAQSRRWLFTEIVKRGYASMTASYHDFFPDNENGWLDSMLGLFYTAREMSLARKHFSAIGVWAWGLSRLLDLAECMPEIDAKRVAVHGHSRLGKTSLWAGVLDRRFKLICVNDAGCGGTALSRRIYGETLKSMINVNHLAHWFVPEITKYIDAVDTLPIDQHELVALAAPHPIAIHSATLDQWADPRGEYLSAYHAGEVYRLFGGKGLVSVEPPEPDTPLNGDVSYLLRTGKHDQLAEDWAQYLELADCWL